VGLRRSNSKLALGHEVETCAPRGQTRYCGVFGVSRLGSDGLLWSNFCGYSVPIMRSKAGFGQHGVLGLIALSLG